MDKIFHIIESKGKKTPIVVSVPHCGTAFPDDRIAHYNKNLISKPDDTDWFVHNLYNFATELGVTIIYANYSRWVIDLNRDPDSKPLYNDGRIITSLTPTTDFFGNQIYINEKFHPNEEEVNHRLKTYYFPYYNKISELLEQNKNQFGKALLWDAHSIRKFVPTIQKEPFPDLILGDNDQKSAHKNLINCSLSELHKSSFDVSHNFPFKGGHITRFFGNPENNIHALQLEMSKKLYMTENELEYDVEKSSHIKKLLKNIFLNLITELNKI